MIVIFASLLSDWFRDGVGDRGLLRLVAHNEIHEGGMKFVVVFQCESDVVDFFLFEPNDGVCSAAYSFVVAALHIYGP